MACCILNELNTQNGYWKMFSYTIWKAQKKNLRDKVYEIVVMEQTKIYIVYFITIEAKQVLGKRKEKT